MNQPTREEFNDHEARIKKLEHQQTEPIKAVRVEVASEDVVKRLDNLEQGQEEIKEDTNITKIQMEGARADILQIRESQADLRDRLIEHSEDLKVIKDKQDAHTEVLGQIVNVGESNEKIAHEVRNTVDRIEEHMFKQDDRISQIEGYMIQILTRLPQPEGE